MVDKFDLSHLPQPRTNGNGNGHIDIPSVIRQLASDISQRNQLAARAGITFGGKRDLYSALGYPRILTTRDYRDRYKRGGISARIVEAFPDATWGAGAEIVEDEDPEITTDLEEEFESLDKRLQVWSILHRADILCGLGEFSVVLIGAPGKLEEELPAMQSQEDVLYLAPYAPDEVQIQTFEENVESPRYGLPTMYSLQRQTRSQQQRTTQSFTRQVHWTRVIHIADTLLEDRVFGIPRLERVWNDLDNLEKVVGGGSEAFWLRVNQGFHWNVDKDVKIGPDDIQKLKEEAEELAHQMRRTMATRGMNVTALGSDVAPFENPVRALVSLISGATKIPQRILLGSERGELASTQDRENWNDRIVSRRLTFGTPLVRVFVTRLMESGALPMAEEYDVRWPEIKSLTMSEQADVAAKWAGLGERIVLPEEIRDTVLGLEKLDDEQLAGIEAKEQEKKEADLEKLKNQPPPFGQPPGKGFPPKGGNPFVKPKDDEVDEEDDKK